MFKIFKDNRGRRQVSDYYRPNEDSLWNSQTAGTIAAFMLLTIIVGLIGLSAAIAWGQ